MESIKGWVISNDGDTALVEFNDSARKLFTRDAESVAEFEAAFPVNREIEAQTQAFVIEGRDDLFRELRNIFANAIEKTGSVIEVHGPDGTPKLIGQGLTIGNITVFCAPGCETPDGSEGQVFALQYADGSDEWLDLNEEDFEYACGRLQESYNVAVASASYGNN
jgi:hypothetical protein